MSTRKALGWERRGMWHDEEYDEPAVPIELGDIARLVTAYAEAVQTAERLNAAFALAEIVVDVVPTLSASGAPLVQFDVSPTAAQRLAALLARGGPAPPGFGGAAVIA